MKKQYTTPDITVEIIDDLCQTQLYLGSGKSEDMYSKQGDTDFEQDDDAWDMEK